MRLEEVTKIQPDRREYKPCKSLLLNRRDIGIEIECEGVPDGAIDTLTAPELWNLVSDHSLRDGVELVSSVVRGADVLTALDSAQSFVQENGLTFSDRCSVHIHLDVRRYTTQELLHLVTLYCIFEDFFYSKCGSSDRALNNHCRPVLSSTGMYKAIKSLFSESCRSVHSGLAGWPKYCGLNLAPVTRQGSVEFRHHGGTADPEELLTWINTIFSLAKAVTRDKGTPLQDVIDSVCADGEGLFRRTFPKYADEFTYELHDSMLEGARYIQVPINTYKEPSASSGVMLSFTASTPGDLRGLADSGAARGGTAEDWTSALGEEEIQHRVQEFRALVNRDTV